ncbi:MAG: hypothetical protein WCT19_02120 [Candidatus Paceibacterota bacterium]|jgi:DNA polymerase III delta prime subunit
MEALDKLFGKDLHHSYCLEGNFSEIFPVLSDFIENKFNIKTRGNPDFWSAEFDVFSVDDGRNIKEMEQMKSAGTGGKKFFVISFNFATREAQNSLLKIFEEPTPDTHFFVITPSAEILLPTLRSRMAVISPQAFFGSQKKPAGSHALFSASAFLSATIAERLKIVKKLTDDISDEKTSKRQAIDFVEEIEKTLRQKTSSKLSKELVFTFTELEKCRQYLFDRSSSAKMILEHLSLILPTI